MTGDKHDRPMTFTDHLAELRSRILKSIAALGISFLVAWNFHERLFHWIARPVLQGLRRQGITQLQALQVTETVIAHLHASLLGALVLAAPAVFYQAWAFVAPGLFQREKRIVLPAIGLLSAFFLLGVLFCYFVFLPLVVEFLVAFTTASGEVVLQPTVQQTFRLAVVFLAVFGLVFEIPLLMFFLSFLGVVSASAFRRHARYFLVFSFVIGAVLTPPDPLSQVLMAFPLCALYLVGVAFARAGETLRHAKRTARALVLAMGVFLAFAGSVGAAAWYWNRPAPPDLLPVWEKACLRLDCRLDSSLGRACLGTLPEIPNPSTGHLTILVGREGRVVARSSPGRRDDCPGTTRDTLCILEGPEEVIRPEAPAPREPVRLQVEAPCLDLLFADLPEGEVDGTWTLTWREDPTPLVTATLRVEGRASTRWPASWDPGEGIVPPIASLRSWGDWESTAGAPDLLETNVVMLPGRARREVRDLSARLSIRPLPDPRPREARP